MIPVNPPFETNQAVFAVVLSWFISQLMKVIRGIRQEKRFNFRWLFDTGGMPSSHSATVSSLATVTGLYYGFYTIIFLIVVIFTIITMFDAAGVRRSVGKQAAVLNKMIDEGGIQEQRLKEFLGHTPVEVFAGAFLGIVIAMVVCNL